MPHKSNKSKLEYNREWRKNNLEKVREYYKLYWEKNRESKRIYNRAAGLRRKYGLTIEEFDCMVRAQSGCCLLCKRPLGDDMYIDHNHETGRVRGVLHQTCNSGIGFLGDDAQMCRLAAEYLESFADF
jgi:hypothetical protein